MCLTVLATYKRWTDRPSPAPKKHTEKEEVIVVNMPCRRGWKQVGVQTRNVSTVAELKQELERGCQIPRGSFTLAHGGRTLKDTDTVPCRCGAPVELWVRLMGGGGGASRPTRRDDSTHTRARAVGGGGDTAIAAPAVQEAALAARVEALERELAAARAGESSCIAVTRAAFVYRTHADACTHARTLMLQQGGGVRERGQKERC